MLELRTAAVVAAFVLAASWPPSSAPAGAPGHDPGLGTQGPAPAVAGSVPRIPSVVEPPGGLAGGDAPAAPPTGLSAEWQRVPLDVAVAGGAGPDLVLSGLAAVPGGLVAVGADARGGVILASPDGIRWTRQPDDPTFDGTSLSAVARGADATVAVARNRQAVWVSRNGVSWTRTGLAGSTGTADVAASPGAYVVAGTYRTPPDATGARRTVAATWSSTDARTWTRILLPAAPVVPDVRPVLLRYAGSRFVLFARQVGPGVPARLLVWVSRDGRHWTRGTDVPLAADGMISDVTTRPDGVLLAAGWLSRAAPARAVLYASTDGLRWAALPDQPAFAGSTIRGVACVPAGCVAVGSAEGQSPSEARSWVSLDGVAWSVTDGTAALGDVGMQRVAFTGQGLAAVGWARTPVRDTAVNAAAFWISPPTTLPDPVPPAPVRAVSGSWQAVAPMHVARTNPVAALGRDGRIYVFGGRSRRAGSTATAETTSMEIYDPATDTWTFGPPIPGPGRTRAAAVTANDGRIFLFHAGSPLVLAFDPIQRRWSTAPSVPGGRFVASAFRGPGRVLYVSAWRDGGPQQLFAFDPASGRWMERGATSVVPCALGPDGLLYALTTWRAWSVDRVTGATTKRAPTPALAYGKVVSGPGGLIWQIGYGYDYPAPGFTGRWMAPRVQAYDPATDTWATGPLPSRPRWAHALVAAGNRIYAIGGSTGGSTNGVEVLAVATIRP